MPPRSRRDQPAKEPPSDAELRKTAEESNRRAAEAIAKREAGKVEADTHRIGNQDPHGRDGS